MKKKKNNISNLHRINLHDKLKLFYEAMYKSNIGTLQITVHNYDIYIKRKDVNINTKNEILTTKVITPKQDINITSKNETEVPKIKETIKSPIVGTFYKAPAPTLKPFVNEGDIVENGTVICLIEAMKVINEIKTSYKLKIIKFLVNNGEAVNTGQDLFEVEKII
jgi:acetyl-CoA carboxylase biotin carboxyl carrier protein